MSSIEDRVLRALDGAPRTALKLPTHCAKCGKPVSLDRRAGEIWHDDSEANKDHRPEYQ